MNTTPWWASLLVSWIPFIVLVIVWIILARGAKGRGLWGLQEAQVQEMSRANALLERIAVALEKRTMPNP